MPEFTDNEEEMLYNSAKQLLYTLYEPGHYIRLSTSAIYNALQKHIPGDFYRAADVAAWMLEGNFTTVNVGDIHLEWILQKRIL